ncbi:MAG: HAD-IIB family hydrolase [Cyanobacteria bacterium J06628_6]
MPAPLPSEPVTNWLVATDLDATLLDHETYSYAAALPAIERLKARNAPIIFNSSKTQAEQVRLRNDLGLQAPFIVENGAAVVIPPGQLDHPSTAATDKIQAFGPAYDGLVQQVDELRRRHGYRFRGFADMSAAEVTEVTGLTAPDAEAAKQRTGSEPLLWQDSEAAYGAFQGDLAHLNLQTTQGGRFRHVTAQTDKGQALIWLVNQYRTLFPVVSWTVVALGDSPNDVPMLRVADIAILIPNPHRPAFVVTDISDLKQATQTGPAGWAEAVLGLV